MGTVFCRNYLKCLQIVFGGALAGNGNSRNLNFGCTSAFYEGSSSSIPKCKLMGLLEYSNMYADGFDPPRSGNSTSIIWFESRLEVHGIVDCVQCSNSNLEFLF